MKLASMAPSSIPFHVPSIPKPQLTYKHEINNSNTPFLHPSLPRSQDGSARPVHPAESFDPVQFTSSPPPSSASATKPPPLDKTPFNFVDDMTSLSYLSVQLAFSDEFAVDLEHHGYRTYQGMTCLMQISTRTEDFVVDTLKLKPYIEERLGRFFRDPKKRKIMHGATNDMIWLQRDFGIYVVNLFDTMQASRIMQMERNSFEYLLKYYCDVEANKQYQTADWRIRPLPTEMVHYARDDTHYLLYIYDRMRRELVLASERFGFEDPLAEVYRRSHGVCMRLYEKKVYDKEISYLHMTGLRDADLDSRELAVVAGLSEWRDGVAREEDESTGYILPNKQLIEIAKRKPLSKKELLDSIPYSRPFVVRDADKIVEIIYQALFVHASKFNEVVHELRAGVPLPDIIARHEEIKKQNHEEETIDSDDQHESEEMMDSEPSVSSPPIQMVHPPQVWVVQRVVIPRRMLGRPIFLGPRCQCHPSIVAFGHPSMAAFSHYQHPAMYSGY